MIGFIIKTMAPSNMLPTFLLFQQPQTSSLRIDSANNADSYASWLFSLDHYNTANVRNGKYNLPEVHFNRMYIVAATHLKHVSGKE